MFYTIYKITNKINNKYYIGKHQTKNINDNYMGSGKLLKRAIKKYGIENFKKEILHVFETEEEMNIKEKELVVISEDTYNLCEGGQGGFGYINSNNLAFGGNQKEASLKGWYATFTKMKNDDEFKKKRLQDSFRGFELGRKIIKEKYPNGTKSFLGKTHKEETKKLIGQKNSANQQGKNNSQYGTCWITNGKENTKIKKEEFDKWFEFGYHKGRICKSN
jgi:hypothetical protein